MRPVERARGRVGVLPETIAGALAYCTIVPAIIFLLVEPYSKNRFVRFHSFQCIGLCLAGVAVGAALRAAGVLLFFIPLLGHLLVALVSMVVSLGLFVIWIVLVVKGTAGGDVQTSGGWRFCGKAGNWKLRRRLAPACS